MEPKNNVLDPEYVETCIKNTQYVRVWEKTTVCLLTMDNDFEIVWLSHVFSKENFDAKIWEDMAYNDAMMKAIEFIAFRMRDMATPNNQPVPDVLVPEKTEDERTE